MLLGYANLLHINMVECNLTRKFELLRFLHPNTDAVLKMQLYSDIVKKRKLKIPVFKITQQSA